MGLLEVTFQLDLLIVVSHIGFTGYPVDSSVENNPHRRTYDSDELPFCGLGFGWFL